LPIAKEEREYYLAPRLLIISIYYHCKIFIYNISFFLPILLLFIFLFFIFFKLFQSKIGGEQEEISFLETILIAMNINLLLKATNTMVRNTLYNILLAGNISDNRSSVWALAVLKLYNIFYDQIIQTAI
jgi:hypothetical protein